METIRFDGASKGNPGRGSCAATLVSDPTIYKTRTSEGSVTNNQAEFHGLLLAISIAKEQGFQDVEFQGDSQLVVKLTAGEWNAKDEKMIRLLAHAKTQLQTIKKWSTKWIPRAQNAEADRLCNEALSRTTR